MADHSSTCNGGRRLGVFLAGLVMSIGVTTLTVFDTIAHASVGAPVDAGEVVVVDAADASKVLATGGSATRFTLRLPTDASCPGDSEHDQWRVQSFVVPDGDDPGALHYGEIGPDGAGQWALYSADTHAFAHILTLANSQAGQPGRIDTMPTFSFVLFPPGTLPDGRYRVGIACTYFRKTAKYWDTVLVLTTSPNDAPGNLVWRVDAPDSSSSASGTTGSGSSAGRWAGVGAGVLGVAALMFVLWQRSVRRTKPLLKEHS